MLTIEQKEKVLEICRAYEEGFSAGYKAEKVVNPYYINKPEHYAWEVGYSNGTAGTYLLTN